MFSRLKTTATVVAFTLLIWLAADFNVSESQTFSILVSIRGADPDQYVALADGAGSVRLDVTMYGRRIHRERFREDVKNRTLEAVVAGRDFGEASDWSTQNILAAIPEIESSRLTIRGVEPSVVSILSDEYVIRRGVRVEPDFGDFQVSWNAEPPTVSVRLPKFKEDQVLRDGSIKADAGRALSSHIGANLGDARFRITVSLAIPGCEIEPDTVRLEGVVETPTETRQYGPIPIKYWLPDALQRDFVVEPEEGTVLIRQIGVMGPKTQLDQLRAQDIDAYVQIKAEYREPPDRTYSVDIQYVLPRELPGLEIVSEPEQQRIEFRLKRRPANGTKQP